MLDRGDLIVAIEVPASAERRAARITSRSAIANPTNLRCVSAAAAVATDGSHIRSARLAMGGVAHKPWRLTAAETALRGVRSTIPTR